MLSIYLQNSNKDALDFLEEYCKYKVPITWQSRVVVSDTSAKKINDVLNERANLGLFIIEEHERLIEEIRKSNYDDYIILLISDLQDLLLPRPLYYRFSGFLMNPVDSNALQSLLEIVYHDFVKADNSSPGSFNVKIKGAIYPVKYSSMLFFESVDKKIVLRTTNQIYEFYGSLTEISESLPKEFLRIHRSFCINLKLVEKVDFTLKEVYLTGGITVPFARTYREALKDALNSGYNKE